MDVHDADADGGDDVVTALRDACRRGDTDQVMKLLNAAASDSVNATDTNGDTLLITACRHGKLDVVRVLMAYEVDVNLPDGDGASPLCVASERGYLEIVQTLLQHGADVNVAKRDGDIALNLAAQRGFTEIVNLLLKYGAVVDRPQKLTEYDSQEGQGERGERGEQPVAKRGEHGQVDRNYKTRSMEATPMPSVDRAFRIGHRMRKYAFRFSQGNFVISPPSVQSFPTAVTLHGACRNGDLEKVQSFLANGSMIDDIDLTGETPFHIAAQHGHADIVSFLLANRAQVNVLDRAGNTPLIAASRYGCVNVVQVLLELGASVNHVNALGETALIIAAESGQFDVVEELIKANASVHVRSAAGETLLTCAARWSQDDIVNQIIELGCSKLDGIEASEPSLLSATLDKLQQCGGSMDEFEEAWLGVLERLRQVYSLIVQSGGENEQWSILPSFVMILFLLCKQRASPDHKNLITRVCSSRKSMRAIEDLHSRLDRLQRKFASDRASSTWRETSQTNQDIAWKRFHTAINDDTQLLADLNTKADLVEAISLLQYEIVVHGGKYSQESLDLLQRSLDKLLMLSDEEVPDLPQWFVPPHDVDLIICEEGPESKRNNGVTRGKWLGTDIMVVKSRCAREDVLKDVDLWFQMSHPNVLKLYGACHLRSSYMAIIDNVQSTNLREYLAIDENSHLKWQKLFEVGLGIKYLHERECVVGDLRCDRLWVGMDRLAKITPFIGDIICSKPRTASDAANYRPPECLKGKEAFTTASDIFLFGLCILEAVTGNWSWVVEARGVAASSVGWTKLPPRPVEMSLPEWQLIESMCLFDPSKRVKIAYVVEHLKRFVAERREIEATENSKTANAATAPRSDDLQRHIFPQLETTIEKFLEKLDAKSRLTGDSGESVEIIYKRIFDIYLRLMEMHKRPGDPEVTKFCEMLVEIDTFLGVVAVSKTSAVRRARSVRVSLQFNVLHRKIDELLGMLKVSDFKSVVHRWKPAPIKNYVKQVEIGDTEDESSSNAREVVRVQHFQGTGHNYKFQRIDSFASDDPNSEEVIRFPWFIPYHEINHGTNDRIGEDGFGSLYRGLWLGTPVVIKSMGYEEDPRTVSRELFLHELRIWYPLHHPHVIKLFGAFPNGKRLFVCEYAPHGNLHSFFQHNENKYSIKWNKLLEAALGLQYLHDQSIVHNSLTCDSILIGANGKAKIVDFGLSSIPNSAEVMIDVRVQGAIHWKSPEYLRGDRPTLASDVYSFGMCILEAVTDDIPWGRGMVPAFVRYRVARKGQLPHRPPAMSDRQWDLIEMMCAHEPSKRLSMQAVVDILTEFAHRESATNACK